MRRPFIAAAGALLAVKATLSAARARIAHGWHAATMLFENWPQFFTVEEDAVLPAEELVKITRGSDNGWPYCFHDAVFEHRKVLAPEYGGDGQRVSGGPGINCATYNRPLVSFGGHWAPSGMHFYSGRQFPERYRGGAFVAFHGGFGL